MAGITDNMLSPLAFANLEFAGLKLVTVSLPPKYLDFGILNLNIKENTKVM